MRPNRKNAIKKVTNARNSSTRTTGSREKGKEILECIYHFGVEMKCEMNEIKEEVIAAWTMQLLGEGL